MAVSWMAALKVVPWGKLMEHAPQVLDKARSLIDKHRNPAAPNEVGTPPAADEVPSLGELKTRLQVADAQIAQLVQDQRQLAQSLADLAEQNACLISAVQKQRRLGWLLTTLMLAVLLLLGYSAAAQAQEWAPSRPVRIIVPIVGSTNDVLARMLAPKLQEVLGQAVVVENKPGAGGNLGADMVAKAAADGHTLLIGYNGPMAINVSLFDKMPYDPQKDLAPITLAVKSAQYLVAYPGAGLQSVQDLVQQARANPNKFSYGSVAVGSASHLTMEMFKMASQVNLTHIPYKGAGPAVTDLIAGNIQLAFLVPGNVQQFVKEGRLKLLASSGTKRFASTPQVPTLIESGLKDFEATSWIGLLTTGGTPKPIIDRYHKELVRILQLPDIRDKLHDMEFEVMASTPEQFGAWIAAEIPRWGKVIKATGAKAD